MAELSELLVRNEHLAAVEAALLACGYHLVPLPAEKPGAIPSYLVTDVPDGIITREDDDEPDEVRNDGLITERVKLADRSHAWAAYTPPTVKYAYPLRRYQEALGRGPTRGDAVRAAWAKLRPVDPGN